MKSKIKIGIDWIQKKSGLGNKDDFLFQLSPTLNRLDSASHLQKNMLEIRTNPNLKGYCCPIGTSRSLKCGYMRPGI